MRRVLLCCLVLAVVAQSVAQTCALSGKVVDRVSHDAIADAHLFLAGTSLSTFSDENGNYHLKSIPLGKYDLIVSLIGYRSLVVSVDLTSDGDKIFDVQLDEEVVRLPMITVKADTSGRGADLRLFKKYFLGETSNANKCIIRNPQDIILYADTEEKILIAYAKQPIIIENHALGYNIAFYLKKFEMNFNQGRLMTEGFPSFEEMKPGSARLQKKWEQERINAYHGSLIHFMRAFRQNKLKDERFYTSYNASTAHHAESVAMFASKSRTTIDTRALFRGNELSYKGAIRILYRGESEDKIYQRLTGKQNRHYQESLIYFKRGVRIYENGNYDDVKDIFLEGYLAWSEKISELLPLEYVPSGKKKK